MSKYHKYIILTVIAVIVLMGMELRAERAFFNANHTTMTFLDVGQGDATFIRDVDGRTILIDVGPGDRILEVLSGYLPSWKRSIDIVILTHLDADHIAGAEGLLKQYHIGEIWWNGAVATTQKSRSLLSAIRKEEIPLKIIQTGEKLMLSQMSLHVIHPDRNLEGVYLKDKNAESISMRLECGEDIALLAGDAPIETEMDFLSDGDVGDITLLKVSHHGSKNSTSGKFLDAVTPEYAVISSGKGNRYGHPAYRVLVDLRKRGIETYRTDEMGGISFACDGHVLRPI